MAGFATQHTMKASKSPTLDLKTFLVTVKKTALEKFKPQMSE